MKYRKLGTTNLEVSVICLGTMNWGEQNTEKDAFEQLDYAVSEGVNFIDTAEMYLIQLNAESQGRTETYLGNWMQKRRSRKNLIIVSKVASKGGHVGHHGISPASSGNEIAAHSKYPESIQFDYARI